MLPTQHWIQDLQTKNLEDVLALYTPDAVFVDPEGNKFATPDALRKLYTQVFATYDADLTRGKGTIAIQGNPQVAGAVAVESAEFSENLPPAPPTPQCISVATTGSRTSCSRMAIGSSHVWSGPAKPARQRTKLNPCPHRACSSLTSTAR